MSKLTLVLLLGFFGLSLSTKYMGKGEDCDLFNYCVDPYVCKDYRCAEKGTKENQMEWAPDGDKCDYFHYCPTGYSCESHRCILSRQKIVDAIIDSLKADQKKKEKEEKQKKKQQQQKQQQKKKQQEQKKQQQPKQQDKDEERLPTVETTITETPERIINRTTITRYVNQNKYQQQFIYI